MQKILIVEDDADIQDTLKNHLIDAGYEVALLCVEKQKRKIAKFLPLA